MELTPAQKFDATIRAAAAGDVCVCCFRLMPPGASVTMVRRQLRQPGRPSPFGRVPDGHTSVAVPVCLDCTLSDRIEQRRGKPLQGLRARDAPFPERPWWAALPARLLVGLRVHGQARALEGCAARGTLHGNL